MGHLQCKHGNLARVCGLCDAETEIAYLRARVAELEQRNLSLEVFAPEIDKIEDVEKQLASSQARERLLRDALEEFDALIAYQYTGSQEAMSALQYAINRGVEALAACKDV